MVEVCEDEISGVMYMIEANPRIWGPIQFVLDQGVDLLAPFFWVVVFLSRARLGGLNPLPHTISGRVGL